jgi:RecB family endonuclease NucS
VNQRQCVPIELKAVEAQVGNVHQIQRYVDWLEQYYIPNMPCDIRPVLMSKEFSEKAGPEYAAVLNSFKQFNSRNTRCHPLDYIEYKKSGKTLVFAKIPY